MLQTRAAPLTSGRLFHVAPIMSSILNIAHDRDGSYFIYFFGSRRGTYFPQSIAEIRPTGNNFTKVRIQGPGRMSAALPVSFSCKPGDCGFHAARIMRASLPHNNGRGASGLAYALQILSGPDQND
jgi:hypothetical protein